jgi:hypothetical protein
MPAIIGRHKAYLTAYGGVEADTATHNPAFDAASAAMAAVGGGEVVIDPGRWAITNRNLPNKVNCIGLPGSILAPVPILVGAPDVQGTSMAIEVESTYDGPARALVANAAAGDFSVNVGASAGTWFAPGDYVVISKDEWVAFPYGRKQEIQQVDYISGSFLIWRNVGASGLRYAYETASNATVQKLTPRIGTTIHGITVECQQTNTSDVVGFVNAGGGIAFRRVIDGLIQDSRCFGAGSRESFILLQCLRSNFVNDKAFDGQEKAAAGRAYGISIDDHSMQCFAHRTNSRGMRENVLGVGVIDCGFNGHTSEDDEFNAVNTHSSGVLGGSIRNCTARRTRTGPAFSVSYLSGYTYDRGIEVSDCKAIDCARGALQIAGSPSTQPSKISVANFTAENCCKGAASLPIIYLDDARSVSMDNINVFGGDSQANTSGIQIIDGQDIRIDGFQIDSVSGISLDIQSTGETVLTNGHISNATGSQSIRVLTPQAGLVLRGMTERNNAVGVSIPAEVVLADQKILIENCDFMGWPQDIVADVTVLAGANNGTSAAVTLANGGVLQGPPHYQQQRTVLTGGRAYRVVLLLSTPVAGRLTTAQIRLDLISGTAPVANETIVGNTLRLIPACRI